MRCVACNCRLTEQEATRKMVNTGEYPDLCNHCFSTISDQVAYVEGTGASDKELGEDYENDSDSDYRWPSGWQDNV